MKLSPTVSYQSYDDIFIVMDAVTGLDIELNTAGGTIIKNIDSGKLQDVDPNSEFIKYLIKIGVIIEDYQHQSVTSIQSSVKKGTAVFDDLNNYASQRIIPVSAILELTYRCPLDCKHCYIDRSETSRQNELKKEEYFQFIDEFRQMGGLYVILTGGDPFLHPDIEDIFNYLRKKRIAVSIMSSGFKTDKNILKKLAASGLTSFQASIHGSNSEVHDSFTKVIGSYSETLKTLEFLKNLGVKVQAAISVNKKNILYFDSILRLFKEKNIETVFNFEMFPKRNGDNSPVSLNISDKELEECINKIDWKPDFRLRNRKPEDPSCNSARTLFSIDPAGNIFPCLEIREKAGNITRDSFSGIWKNSDVFNKVRDIKIQDLKDCVDCDNKNFCNRCHGGALKLKLPITYHSDFDCKFAKLQAKQR